jgi:hypothetical protein
LGLYCLRRKEMKVRTATFTLAAAAALLQTFTALGGAAPVFAVGGGGTQAGTAILTVTSGLAAPPGAANPLAGKPLILFRESFDAFLRRRGMFQGPPGAPAKLPPLGVWAYSCQTGSPACKQALYEMRPLSAGEVKTDAAGRGVLPGVPPGTYYLFSLAPHNGRLLVWDLRVVLKPGSNSVTLDQRNSAPLDADAARANPPAGEGESAADSRPCPAAEAPRAPRPGAQANSVLSVVGTGYVYTRTTVDSRTGQPTGTPYTERGNFSHTTLYLLDEDADVILQRAGIEPGMMGSRLGMLAFLDAGTQLEKVSELGALAAAFGQPGALSEITAMSKPDLDCAMKSIRAHSLAEMTTDANARGTFPGVPPGTYYLFGRFYRVNKPVRAGAVSWNQRVTLRPGQNLLRLSVDNAALK